MEKVGLLKLQDGKYFPLLRKQLRLVSPVDEKVIVVLVLLNITFFYRIQKMLLMCTLDMPPLQSGWLNYSIDRVGGKWQRKLVELFVLFVVTCTCMYDYVFLTAVEGYSRVHCVS